MSIVELSQIFYGGLLHSYYVLMEKGLDDDVMIMKNYL